MATTDAATHGMFGYYYFPNFRAGVTLLFLAPLSAIMSIEVNVKISSRVSDVCVSQQLGFLTVFPMAGIYLAGELNMISFDITTLLFISIILVVVDSLLLYLVRATFNRDEILIKWK